MKKKIAILGLGHIGEYVRKTLSKDKKFNVNGYDITTGHDLSNHDVLKEIIQKQEAVIASTPFYLNKQIALNCATNNVAYFDLTEGIENLEFIKKLNSKSVLVPACGLAPGIVSVIANNIASKFENVRSIDIKVGALPKTAVNLLGYEIGWSVDGLLKEYLHSATILENGKLTTTPTLSNISSVVVNDLHLESSPTSGGIGTLAETWQGKADSVKYETLRFPGHFKLMQFIKNDLQLEKNFSAFVDIFNKSIPQTKNDKVIILIKVIGNKDNNLIEESYSKVIESDEHGTAIQKTTAGPIMSIVEAYCSNIINITGFIKQEELNYDTIMLSKYMNCYK